MNHQPIVRQPCACLLAAVCFVWSIASLWAQIPTIELAALSRCVGQAASSFPVAVPAGTQLDEVRQLVFSHPEITAKLQTLAPRLLENEPRPNYGNFDVTIGSDVRPGIYEVRALGRFGLSNPRAFLVTSSPVQHSDQEHSTPQTALDLSQQQIVLDRALPQRRNYYRIDLAAGDQVAVFAHGRRLDSRAIVALTLIDPQGKEVARGRGMDSMPGRIQHTATTGGSYLLIAYDFLFQGGPDYYYALQAMVTPPGSAGPTDCELARLCGDPMKSQMIVPAAVPGSMKPTAQEPAAATANWLQPEHFSTAVGVEHTVPFTVSGDFANNSRSASFDFKAAAGQKLWLEVASAKLDQLTDPRLILYKVARDDQGKETLQQVGEQDDATTIGGPAVKLRLRDPYLQYTAPENATYRVMLIDNAAGNRPADSVRFVLQVREARPTFELVAYTPYPINTPPQSKPIGSRLLRGGTEAVHVLLMRKDGFNEPIELSAENLPAGVACTPTVIPREANSATLVLQATEDAAPWTGSLKIIGRSLTNSPSLERVALTACILRAVTPTVNSIQSRLTANQALCVDASDVAPTFVQLGDGGTVEMSRGGNLPFTVRVTRRAGGNVKLTLRPQDLPPKCKLAEIGIEADKQEAKGELQIAPDAPLGEFTFWMQYEAKPKIRLNPQLQERAEVYVAKLKQAIEDPAQAPQKAELEMALKTANEELEKAKQATAEKEVTAFLPSTALRVRIVESPVRLSAPLKHSSIIGEDAVVDVQIERKFGFADAVDLNLAGNPPIEGLQFISLQIPAGSQSGKLTIKIPATAKPQTLSLPIKLDCKFNGHALSSAGTIELTIEPKSTLNN